MLIAMLFIMAIAFVLLFIVKTEITVLSRGLIRSASEHVPIIVPVSAEILKSSLAENRFVNSGDTLLWLNKEKYEEKIVHLQNRIDENNDYLNDIALLQNIDHYPAIPKTGLFKATLAEYRQQISEFNLSIELLQKSFNRSQMLFEKKVIPLTEKEEKEYQLAKKLEDKNIFININRNKWQQLSTEYITASKEYKNEISWLKKEIGNYFILAPCSGYITNYNGVQPGNFPTSGQVIGVISPSDSIITEHLVHPKNIGYLNTGMPAIFQIDAYNYNQWGLATGNIVEISKEVYIVDNQPFFKVRCKINEKHLSLKNGYKGELKKGLTTTARFKITQRSVAQLLFDKADNWLNPNIVNE